MTLSTQRRKVELAAARAHASANAYRQSAERLQSRLRRDWRLPIASGLGAGAIASLLPVAAIVRAGSTLLQLAMALSRVPYGALSRLTRNAPGTSDSSRD